MYSVKEIFYTLQGEGAQTGRAAVFMRFSGCNLWSGREEDRSRAVCTFCDTDFVGTSGPGGGKFRSAGALAAAARSAWPASAWPTTAAGGSPFVVCTGGEPLLQLDDALIAALHEQGFEIAIESNGTLPAPAGVDWICVSPKAGAPLRQVSGDELKLVFPQTGAADDAFGPGSFERGILRPSAFEALDFTHFFLQPKDGPDAARNLEEAAAYCLAHPRWRLSLQTHKLIGLP
jgi:7-carboxy-7-deazaguanine synthase